MELRLTDPVIVARNGDMALIASGDVVTNLDTDAQTWSPEEGYSEVKPLQVWLKFLYYLDEVQPPQPWIEPA